MSIFRLKNTQKGAILDPGASFLVNRGLCTLPTRMEQHCKNAKKFVEYYKKTNSKNINLN